MKVHLYSTIWKSALAAGLAWTVAEWTSSSRPYFAPLAAILCIQVTVVESVYKGYERVIGIVVGVLVATLVIHHLGIHAWSIALIVFLGTLIATLVRLTRQAVPQVGVTAMMVMVVGGPHSASYAFDRVTETIIGAITAVVVNMFVVPPDYSREAVSHVQQAAEDLAGRFHAIAHWLKKGAVEEEVRSLQADTRKFLERVHETEHSLDKALRAVQYSPLVQRRGMVLKHLVGTVQHLRQGYAHATGMVRIFGEYRSIDMGEEARRRWSEWMMDAGELIVYWGKQQAMYGADLEKKRVQENRQEADNLQRRLFSSAPTVKECLRVLEQSGDEKLTLPYEMALWNDLRQLMEDFRVVESIERR